MLLALSLVGCAVSKNPNPVIRYGANTGATLAGPGFAAMCVAGALSEDGSSDKDVEQLGLFGIAAAAGGFVVGAVLGERLAFSSGCSTALKMMISPKRILCRKIFYRR